MVAGVVTFVLTDTVKAAFGASINIISEWWAYRLSADVLDYSAYIQKQAFAVLKRVWYVSACIFNSG